MNPSLSLLHAQVQTAELRRAASRSRRRTSAADPGPEVAIRQAVPADAADLELLAQLEGRPLPPGPALVAVQDGGVLASLPLDGSPAFADPFRRTAEIVDLLVDERRRLRRASRPGRGRRLLAGIFRRPPAAGHASVSAPVVPGTERLLGGSAWRC